MRIVQRQTIKPPDQRECANGGFTIEETPALSPLSFEHLFETYCDRVIKYCYYNLGSLEDAEDTAQRVFEKALGAWSRFESDQSENSYAVRSWIFAIAHNEIANRHRSNARHRVESLDGTTELHDAGPTPEESAILSDNQGRLRSAIQKLSPDLRQAVELRLFGFSDTEIARLLDKTPGAIRTAQCRAVVRIRELMGIAIPMNGGRDV